MVLCHDRNSHIVCDHLGGAEASLWWYRVRWRPLSSVMWWNSFARALRLSLKCRCWDMNDNAAIWWVIKGPVLASIMVWRYRDVCVCDCAISLFHCILISFNSVIVVFLQINFVLFIGIIVILVQKLQSPDIGGNESSIYLWVNLTFHVHSYLHEICDELVINEHDYFMWKLAFLGGGWTFMSDHFYDVWVCLSDLFSYIFGVLLSLVCCYY